jgi:heptosyltransferase-2
MTDRVALVFAKSLGFFFSKIPFSLLEKTTEFLALLLMSIPNSRRRLLISNLRHAFPKWEYNKVLSVARESSARMFEMGFFSLCYPFMSKDQLRHTVFYDDDTEAKLEELRKTGKPVLLLIPHTCLFETLATSPFFRPLGNRFLGAIYRPNKNPRLDQWITLQREQVGIKTFSRKAGIIKSRSHLKDDNWLAVLYDQNAGLRGIGCSFLGRPCSISPLPDLLSKNTDVLCVHAIARRISFFRSKLELDILTYSSGNLTREAHRLLENKISNCPKGLPEWLWSHGKWKVNDMDHEFFGLQDKLKPILPETCSRKSNRLIIRMPNWLGDIVMAIPVLKAILHGRADMHVTLLCKPQYAEWLKSLELAHMVYPLEQEHGVQYYFQFLKLRKEYPDAQLNFTNSLRGDIEAFIIGTPKRFGLRRRGKRLLLNRVYNPLNLSSKHQTKIWADMLTYYGFRGEFDYSHLKLISDFSTCKTGDLRILIAPGSQNTPDKRLATSIWIKICRDIFTNFAKYKPSVELLGTKKDYKICKEIKASLGSENIINSAGATSVLELQGRLMKSRLLICNDSGAMHLANMVGVRVVAIFSVTDAQTTGPIFNSKKALVYKNDFEKESDLLNKIRSTVAELVQ